MNVFLKLFFVLLVALTLAGVSYAQVPSGTKAAAGGPVVKAEAKEEGPKISRAVGEVTAVDPDGGTLRVRTKDKELLLALESKAAKRSLQTLKAGDTVTVSYFEMEETFAYGLWPLVVINSLIFIIFAFSFARPRTTRDWRSLGAFSAFVVALFTEMYGFPLTIYLLSGWLGNSYPGLDLFSHNAGHLWQTLMGWKGDPHTGLLHEASYLIILGGFIVIGSAWWVVYRAQRSHALAVRGPYAYVRHPQYVGFMIVMLGFLLQWPTLITLLMFPVLVTMYIRLARREEREVKVDFGEEYARYTEVTPAFVPRLGRKKHKVTYLRPHDADEDWVSEALTAGDSEEGR